jgi:hypothetical protein
MNLNKKKKKIFYLPYEEIEREEDEKNKILSKTVIIENEKK